MIMASENMPIKRDGVLILQLRGTRIKVSPTNMNAGDFLFFSTLTIGGTLSRYEATSCGII